MRLTGRRQSSNVEDRRGMSTGAKAGIGGIGGIILIAVMTLLGGGNIGDVVTQVVQQQMQGQVQEKTNGKTEFTTEEQELAEFSKTILAGTEDVWVQQFQENGMQYQFPTLVLFTGAVNTACGNGSAAMGPFYCSGDQKLYIDLSFFSSMRKQLNIEAKGDLDFAYAYVIAHEVGHHVEYLRGILGKAHAKMARLDKTEANKISVKLELLADYYAGCWAHYDNEKYQSLSDGDLEEAIDCAEKIGDNYLQEKAQGYSQPESFTHGTSEQRMYWLKKGIETGNWNTTTFAPGELD
ncbi:neutral zinc metallopeptidase [Prevotella sp. HUN102]|uniref:KPN_02809 family neutral zinc metallopeptidase n=1 Tax=Prevotella sp. HUN102 TaxID=1392486 RepID=UPI00048FA864|nr:neutral zinc metallopeptidase [Prevotella sp. HUN102]